ncbi:MAG: hypothetical protein ACK452_10975 [Bacteroidota bacterium]
MERERSHFYTLITCILVATIINFSFQNTYYKFLKQSSVTQLFDTQDNEEKLDELEEDEIENINDSFYNSENCFKHHNPNELFTHTFQLIIYFKNKYTEVQNPPPEKSHSI